jgi:hypothetical protein
MFESKPSKLRYKEIGGREVRNDEYFKILPYQGDNPLTDIWKAENRES